MKLLFRSNILPDFTINTDGGGANSPLFRRIMEWVRPAVYTTNTLIPVRAEPFGTPTPGEGKKQVWFIIAVVGIVLGLAVYGAWNLWRR